jgi:hypothetical protein
LNRASSAWRGRPNPVALVLPLIVAGTIAFALTPPRGPRSMTQFNAGRVADLELKMWQACYAKANVRLFALLVTTMHEQYRYSWAIAGLEAFHLARAAAAFGELRGNYDVVLPDLEAAYARTRDWTHARFDPPAVARAELSWWVARRVPGQNAPDHVGALIAVEYALLYDAPIDRMTQPALLRAEAAALRDAGGAQPDWSGIGRLLHASYTELLEALSAANAD